MAQFDIDGAKKAGYSDAEIADHMAQESGFDAAGARKSGYSDAEIIQHMGVPKTTVLQDVKQGAGNIGAGLLRGAGSIGATILAPYDMAKDAIDGKGLSLESNRARRDGMDDGLQTMGAETDSYGYKGGKLVGEVAGTAGAGGAAANVIAKVAPRAAAAAPGLIEALRTGGMSANGATGAAGVVTRAAGGAANGAISAGMVNSEDAGTGAIVGGVLPGAVQLAGKAGMAVGNSSAGKLAERLKEFARNAPKNDTVRASIEAGYQIPPNMVKPSLANQVIESVSGKQATQQLASVHNAKVTDGLARKALGLADDAPLTKEAMQVYRGAQHAAGYEPVKNMGLVQTDGAFTQALDDITSKYTGKGTIPAVQRDDIRALVDAHKSGGFDAGDAVDAMRLLRDQADEAFRKGDTAIGKTYKDISKAYEDVIERNLQATGNADMLANFRQARQNMAKSFTVEKSIVEGSGGINPQKLAAELQKGKPLTGELKTAAQFANTFKTVAKPLEQVGSPASHNLKSMASALMGGGGFAAMGPAGAAAAAVPFVAPAMARSLMFRQGAQKALVNQAPQASKAAQLAELLANPELQQLLLKTAPQAISSYAQ